MVNRHTAQKIRKIHRYLGIFIGIQFLFWTISGLYFSWTNIDDIHGDQFKNEQLVSASFTNLISPKGLEKQPAIQTIELKEINEKPYYWINEKYLYNASTGILKNGITKEEALAVAKRYMKKGMEVMNIQLITKIGKHHEYREKMLPAYVISYKDQENVKAYISSNNGAFQAVRHRNWRVFDFLWMTHTMDYKSRDNFNTLVLRAFSLLGLITVFSGFLLWYTSSPTVRKIKKRF
jgi:hypothetical protein